MHLRAPPPRTPSPQPSNRASNTSRDTRISIRTLRSAGWTYQQIATHLRVTLRQVQHAVTTQATPRRPSGRPPLLPEAQAEELIEFVCASRHGRRMAYWRLPQTLGWDCSFDVTKGALRRAGFKRHITRRKPLITEPTLITGRLFYNLMRPGLQEEGIYKHRLLVDLAKSLIKILLFNSINRRRDRCSGAAFQPYR